VKGPFTATLDLGSPFKLDFKPVILGEKKEGEEQ